MHATETAEQLVAQAPAAAGARYAADAPCPCHSLQRGLACRSTGCATPPLCQNSHSRWRRRCHCRLPSPPALPLCRYSNPEEGSLQVVVAPVARFKAVGINANITIEDLASPQNIIAGARRCQHYDVLCMLCTLCGTS